MVYTFYLKKFSERVFFRQTNFKIPGLQLQG